MAYPSALEEHVESALVDLALALTELLDPAVYLDLCEGLIVYQVRSECLLVRCFPLQDCLDLSFLSDGIWSLEQFARFFVEELFRDDVLLLLVRVAVKALKRREHFLEFTVLLHEVESFDWADAANGVSVVAATENAEVNELVHRHVEAF